MGSEYHMWNIAYLDSEWRYFDSTSDRGRADYWFNCFNVGADDLTRYVWDRDFTELLTQADTNDRKEDYYLDFRQQRGHCSGLAGPCL